MAVIAQQESPFAKYGGHNVIANGKVFAFTMPTDILTKLMRFDAFFSKRLESCLKNYLQFYSGKIEQSTN